MQLEKFFTWFDYEQCISDVKSKRFFSRVYRSKDKKVSFRFDFYECGNGLWKNDLLVSYNLSCDGCGFGHPCDYDNIPQYENICAQVNACLERNC